jgi:hypothetical protein
MRFNYEAVKEDVRKIGVALIVAAMLAGFLKETAFLDLIFPFLGGVILIFSGSAIRSNANE